MLRICSHVLAAFLLALLVLGCAVEGSPQLIQVLDFAPREAEIGDRLELTGAGFPQGRPAHLLFRGTLHRPGERPVTGVELGIDGTVTSSRHIELAFTDALQARFCGSGDRAAHTTFAGEIEVAFAAASAGAPPVAGVIKKVTIDFRPASASPGALEARVAEAERTLAFVGLRVEDAQGAARGLLVQKVASGSRADDAGIVAGDVITQVEGVRVASKADALVAAGAREIAVSLRRGDDPRELSKQVSVEGLRPAPPTDLLGAVLLLVACSAVLLLFLGPSAAPLAWVERRLAASVRGRRSGSFWRGLAGLARSLDPSTSTRAIVPFLVAAGVSATFVALPLAHHAVGFDLDVGILFVLTVTSLVTVALATGGFSSAERGAYSLVGALRSVLQILSVELPAAVAIVCVVMMTGSLRVQEILRAQGGSPWDWYLFRSPVTVVLFVLFFATTLADGRRVPASLAEADLAPRDGQEPRGRAAVFLLAEWGNVFVMCGTATLLFLGGWQVPGVSPIHQESRILLQGVGAGLFLIKGWVLIAAVMWLRRSLPAMRAAEMTVVAWKYLVPTALVCLGLTTGWLAWAPGRAAQLVISASLCAACGLVVVYVAERVRFGARSDEPRLNPFL